MARRASFASPSLLSLMLIAAVTAPLCSMPRKTPDVPFQVMPRIVLLLRLTVAAAADETIPSQVADELARLEPLRMLLFVMLSVLPAAPPVLLMPRKMLAPVPKRESFWIVLFVIVIVPVAALRSPAKLVTAVVVPLMPIWMESAVVVLPTVLPLRVTLPPVPAVSMPRTTKPTAGVALLAVMPPTLLVWMLSVPVEVAKIPSVTLPVTVEVVVIAPVADAEPTVLPELVPMLTVPPRTLIPAKMPPEVVALLVVEKAILVTVFPCTSEAGELATVISMPRYRAATAAL